MLLPIDQHLRLSLPLLRHATTHGTADDDADEHANTVDEWSRSTAVRRPASGDANKVLTAIIGIVSWNVFIGLFHHGFLLFVKLCGLMEYR